MEGKRCATYIRVSTKKQVEDGFGIPLQKDKCLKMIEMKGMVHTHHYVDEGISGAKDPSKRPDLKRLLEDGKEGKYDCVVFYSLCRLGRTAIIVLHLIDDFHKMGIDVISCKESIDSSTPMGRFQLGVMSNLLELERENIISRTKDGIEQRRLKDGNTGGRPIYGYLRDKDGNITVKEHQAEAVVLIFKLRSEMNDKNKHRHTLEDIGKILIKKGYLPPGKKKKGNESKEIKWHVGTLSKILSRREIYEGCLINGNENEIYWPKILNF